MSGSSLVLFDRVNVAKTIPRRGGRRNLDLPLLGERLRELRETWRGERLASDPLLFPSRFEDRADREVVAFLAASFAFGRVASIKASMERILRALGPSPARFLRSWNGSPIASLADFAHRWVRGPELETFLFALRTHGSLEALFLEKLAETGRGSDDYIPALSGFFESLRESAGARGALSRGVRFLLPSPEAGGACKRAHLFLRWMIRGADGETQGRSDLDLGLWRAEGLTPARLLLPLDTHVHRFSLYLGLTRRPTADLLASREATAVLRRIEPQDPTSFDWSLSRLGILAECVRDFERRRCERCPILPVCAAAKPSAKRAWQGADEAARSIRPMAAVGAR